MPEPSPSAAAPNTAPPTVELCDILLASLKALAEAGEPETACKLAGSACATLRKDEPEQWGRFNKLLHRLSPKTGTLAG
jgi:hypothetical protein